jgi:hypothetical protein
MKQEPEETRIRELFQRLRQEDERRALSFAESWAAALSRVEAGGRSSLRGRGHILALATAAAVLLSGGAIVYRLLRDKPPAVRSVNTVKAPLPQPSVMPQERVEKHKVRAVQPREESRRGFRRKNRAPSGAPIIPTTVLDEMADHEETTDFILLRHGLDLQPMENGEVIRVEMPHAALISLGLPVVPEQTDTLVIADLLIDEDGLARAIRFVR